MSRFSLLYILLFLQAPLWAAGDVPAHPLSEGGAIPKWLAIGPFPNSPPESPQPGANYRIGFHHDYLAPIGGEEKAILTPETQVAYLREDGVERPLVPTRLQANPAGMMDLAKFYQLDHRVAYAFAYVEADKPQKGYFYLGSNDGHKAYVNGEKVSEFYSPDGRPLTPGSESFSVDLKKGLNGILLKVEDGGGTNWGFVLEVYDEAGRNKKAKAEYQFNELRAFQSARLRPDNGGFVIPVGALPDLVWEDPAAVKNAVGEVELTTDWYDALLEKVDAAREPGTYLAYVHAALPNDRLFRRAYTAYCIPSDWKPPIEGIENYIERLPVAPEFEKRYRETASKLSGLSEIPEAGTGEENLAILLSAFERVQPRGGELGFTDTPEIIHDDLHLELKIEILERQAPSELERPSQRSGGPAPVLREGSLEEAEMKPSFPEEIRALCNEWYEKSREPFAVLIARHGVIAFHEAFGNIETDTPLWWASTSKLISGLLFARFVDRGLIEIDDPVGKYLPDLPTEGEKVLTFRQCFTHTTGLEGHGEWGGLRNPWLGNTVANGLGYLQPGRVHNYNGMGYDLAGKAMEAVAGKSVGRLLRENLFDPLGMTNTTMDDLAYDTYSGTEDMATLAQMVLNRGAYGDMRFFSEETFEKLLPVSLDRFFPGLHQEWGLGIVWTREKEPESGDWLPSGNTIGHGAASGALFRVDLDRDLVIIQTRAQGGPLYADYVPKFIQTITAAME